MQSVVERYGYRSAAPWGADRNVLLCRPSQTRCVSRFALEPGEYMTSSGPNPDGCTMPGGPVRRACMRALRSSKKGGTKTGTQTGTKTG